MALPIILSPLKLLEIEAIGEIETLCLHATTDLFSLWCRQDCTAKMTRDTITGSRDQLHEAMIMLEVMLDRIALEEKNTNVSVTGV